MENKENQNREINEKQDEITATVADVNASEKPADDAFKTANRKHRQGWEVPLDEQAFDDSNLGENPEENVGDK